MSIEKYIIRENKEFDAFLEQLGGYTAFCELREKVHLALEKLPAGKFYDITKINIIMIVMWVLSHLIRVNIFQSLIKK